MYFLCFSFYYVLAELLLGRRFVSVFWVFFWNFACIQVKSPCVEAVNPPVGTVVEVNTYMGYVNSATNSM